MSSCRNARQYCPRMPSLPSMPRHSSKSPSWFTLPLSRPEGIFAVASYTEGQPGSARFDSQRGMRESRLADDSDQLSGRVGGWVGRGKVPREVSAFGNSWIIVNSSPMMRSSRRSRDNLICIGNANGTIN